MCVRVCARETLKDMQIHTRTHLLPRGAAFMGTVLCNGIEQHMCAHLLTAVCYLLLPVCHPPPTAICHSPYTTHHSPSWVAHRLSRISQLKLPKARPSSGIIACLCPLDGAPIWRICGSEKLHFQGTPQDPTLWRSLKIPFCMPFRCHCNCEFSLHIAFAQKWYENYLKMFIYTYFVQFWCFYWKIGCILCTILPYYST